MVDTLSYTRTCVCANVLALKMEVCIKVLQNCFGELMIQLSYAKIQHQTAFVLQLIDGNYVVTVTLDATRMAQVLS